MSRLHYSFNSGAAAAVAQPEPEEARVLRAPRRSKLRNRQYLRSAMENLGLFAFGFGASNLVIHFAFGFFYGLPMSSLLHIISNMKSVW